ncbi:RDD family protein [Larsenimonas rhizosphaerae]|uniref:RDD family protein n=1 Tax=Larsenimonas rhizosphaerae TaxID=2944682 RepID=A0AA41ZJH1_9GAMM|nr:RDD family protein [Larsenimonas rhizosphaerae]MCX2522658.1 RDD family protein [Larsenimonas rhizosphaerae]
MIYAGFLKRTAALLIDICLLLGAFQVVSMMLLIAPLVLWEATALESWMVEAIMNRSYLLPLAGLVVTWLYYSCSEASSRQATAGKTLMKLRVSRLDGTRPGFGQATIRHFSKYLSALLMAGFIMAAFTRRKQALHDRIARCVVSEYQSANGPREVP